MLKRKEVIKMPVKWTKPKKAAVAPKAEKPKAEKPKAAKGKGDAPKGKGKKEAK